MALTITLATLSGFLACLLLVLWLRPRWLGEDQGYRVKTIPTWAVALAVVRRRGGVVRPPLPRIARGPWLHVEPPPWPGHVRPVVPPELQGPDDERVPEDTPPTLGEFEGRRRLCRLIHGRRP